MAGPDAAEANESSTGAAIGRVVDGDQPVIGYDSRCIFGRFATVLGAVRADNWLYHKGDVTSEQGRAIKAQIRDAFYPEFDDWKGMVWQRSSELVDQAMAGLAGM